MDYYESARGSLNSARNRPLAVREMQTPFGSYFIPNRSEARHQAGRGDAIATQHAQAIVDRLADLVAGAVRASNDDRVGTQDFMLRQAELLLDLVQSDGA